MNRSDPNLDEPVQFDTISYVSTLDGFQPGPRRDLAVLGERCALIGLCAVRMAYIVWRDYDIVQLQRKLIDESADREAKENASKEAVAKVTAIRASSLRG